MTYEQIRTYFSLLKVQFRYKINKINYFKCRNVHLIQHVDYNKSTHSGKKIKWPVLLFLFNEVKLHSQNPTFDSAKGGLCDSQSVWL